MKAASGTAAGLGPGASRTRAHGARIVTREYPDEPGQRQAGIGNLYAPPARRRHAIQDGCQELQSELLELVLHAPGDPNGRAILEEGIS